MKNIRTDSYTYFALGIVFFPKTAVFSLATHVKATKFNFILLESFYFKTNCSCDVNLLVLFRLQFIDHGRFSRIVETNNNDLCLLHFRTAESHF